MSAVSRLLADLHPIVCAKAEAFLELCSVGQTPVLVYFTYRSIEEQDELYRQGRRGVPGERIVTNAKGGESAHNFRAAFDCIPLVDGQPWWEPRQGQKEQWEETWAKIGKCAEKVGLDWYGDPWGAHLPWDVGHFEEPGWKYAKEFLLQVDR